MTGTWPNGQPLPAWQPPPPPPRPDPGSPEPARLRATLAHLDDFTSWDADSQAGHLRAAHRVPTRWDERGDPKIMRSYHAGAHDRQLQEGRRHG